MTVDELIDWLNSAKRQSEDSGQSIANYPLQNEEGGLFEPVVNHKMGIVFLINVE